MIRFDNVGLRYGTGPEILARRHLSCASRVLSFPDRTIRRRQDDASAPSFHVAPADRGLIFVFGENVADLSAAGRAELRRRIGIVFQDFRLLDHLTTWENVALPLRVMGKQESDYREDVTDLLALGWARRPHRRLPEILSGGEKQSAAIARAVIGRPELLLADEPTGNVDPVIADRLLRLFVELNRLGTSVIIATHDYGLMDQLDAPRLVLLQRPFADPLGTSAPSRRHSRLSLAQPLRRDFCRALAVAGRYQTRPRRSFRRPRSPATRSPW